MMPNIQQLSLSKFIRDYGLSRRTVLNFINRSKYDNPLPAYKICGKWYVDIPGYERWREIEDRNSRKW